VITKDEWNRRAEFAAASKFGEDHAAWYIFKRYAAGPVGVVAAAGTLGLGGYWAWNHVHLPSAGLGPAHLPAVFWVFLVALALGTVITFRPGRFVPAATALVRGVVFALLWLGFVTYGVVVLV
jgi:hypothetical protein